MDARKVAKTRDSEIMGSFCATSVRLILSLWAEEEGHLILEQIP